MKCIYSLFIFIVFVISFGAWSDDSVIVLYENGRQIENYAQIVEKLKMGDKVKFSGGEVFEIKEVLDEERRGNSSRIFQISDEKVIRITQREYNPKFKPVEETHRGYLELKYTEVNIPETFLNESTDEFIIQEKVDVKFSLNNLIKNQDLAKEYGLENIKQKFREFLENTYQTRSIPDFHDDNIIWDGKEWMLLDWREGVDFFSESFDSIDPFKDENRIFTYSHLIRDEMKPLFSDSELDEIEMSINRKRAHEYNLQEKFYQFSAGKCIVDQVKSYIN